LKNKFCTFAKKYFMRQRIYIDTSVIGGYYDAPLEAYTVPLFERIQNGEFIVLISSVTQDELEDAPMQVQELVKNMKSEFVELLTTSDEAIELANHYINEKVVGQSSYTDCLHIALATIHRADFLISWNFRHIVNVQRIRGYNSVNIRNGYKQLEIRSPRDFEKYEDN
jgi:predicted nucleic acid-binding protein